MTLDLDSFFFGAMCGLVAAMIIAVFIFMWDD